MGYARKVVLNCPHGYGAALDQLVEVFLSDGVVYVGVVGQDCARVEDIIDELVVGDGSSEPRNLLTASHPGQSIAEALEFARSLTGEFAGEVELVEL